MHPYVVNKNEVSFLFSRYSVNKSTVDQIDKIIDLNRVNFAQIRASYINKLMDHEK